MSESLSITHEFDINASIAGVWRFIEDFSNWAAYMPGYESSERKGPDDFVWTLQADLGALSRRVTLDVHVARWNGPESVAFTFVGRGEPFHGSGNYLAQQVGSSTHVVLTMEVVPGGAMAKVIRVIAAPVLPRIATQFAQKLTSAIEQAEPRATVATMAKASRPPSILRRWIERFWRRVAG